MKMQSLLPWMCVLGVSLGLAAVYSAYHTQSAQLAQLRQENQELQSQQAATDSADQTQKQSQSEELVRLRQENQDLLRLRNEVHQLREDKQQLTRQLEAAQNQVQGAQAQAQSAQAQVEALRVSAAQAAQAQPAAVATRPGQAPLTGEQVLANTCINNLRQIDGAKQQWALEYKQPANAVVVESALLPYLKGGKLPVCPAGGTYNLNIVSDNPTCSVPGHALPR